jgi:hypothetical protein
LRMASYVTTCSRGMVTIAIERVMLWMTVCRRRFVFLWMCVRVCGMGFGDKVLPTNLRVVTEKKRSINGGRKEESGVPFSCKENGMFSHPRFLGFSILISRFPFY